MTKSLKAKKEKKKDFSKQKMKVGKSLKKAQNETVTTFKSRSIQIMEQLASKEAGSNVTKKRYTIMDLCHRFNHTSANHKLDACSGVKELIGKLSAEQMRESLSPLVSALSRCMLNDDYKLRTTTIRILEALIDKVGSKSLAPHFTLLGRHLSCGLVSLHSDIQASSLQLLHMLLRKAAPLLKLHANTIVPNLLRLLGAKTKSGAGLQKAFTESLGGKMSSTNTAAKSILKKSSENKKNKESSDSKNTLLVQGQTNSKQNCLVWQLDVFVLLTEILQQVAVNSTSNGNANSDNGISRWQIMLQSADPNYLAENVSIIALETAASSSRFGLVSDPDKLESFCKTMLPLLHALWNNMLPESKWKHRGGAMLSTSSSHCLWCLVQLQSVLGRMVQHCTGHPPTQCEWYINLMKRIFGDLLHNHFPFHYAEQSTVHTKSKKKVKSKYDDTPTASSDDLNLRMATTGVSYRLFNDKKNYTLVKYVIELISSEEKVGSYNMQAACNLIMSLIDFFAPALSLQSDTHSNLKSKLLNKSSVANRLLTAAHECYKKLHPLKKERKVLLATLLQLTDADHRHIHHVAAIGEWCSYLVSEVTDSDSSDYSPSLLPTLHQLALRRCSHLSQLQPVTERILRIGADITDEERKEIIALIGK